MGKSCENSVVRFQHNTKKRFCDKSHQTVFHSSLLLRNLDLLDNM